MTRTTPSTPRPAAPGRRADTRGPTGGAGRRPASRPGPTSGGPVAGRRRSARLCGDPRDRPLLERVHALATALVEAEAGRRSLASLREHLCPRLVAQIGPVWHRGGTPRSVVAVIGHRRGPGRFAATAVLSGARGGAIAMELAQREGTWVLATCGRPEDGPLPEPAWTLPTDEQDAFSLAGA